MTLQFDPNQTGIAVDLGGTNVKIGIVNGAGEILVEQSVPTLAYEGPQRTFERVSETALALRDQAGVMPVGLGLGMPGLIEVETGILKFWPNAGPEWTDFPIKDFVQSRVNFPVRVMNDARVATLAELKFGHGKGTDKTLVFYTIGTGLGGGIAIDGKLRLGKLGAAGELGHVIVEPGGRRCGCGNLGCLEAYVSGPALAADGVRLLRSGQSPILNDIVQGDAGKVDARTITEAAEAGDEAAQSAIIRMADYLAIGIAAMVQAVHPEIVVVGGGVSNIGDLLFNTLRERVAAYVKMFPVDDIQIIPSAIGDRAGLLGAGALALM